MAGFCLKDDVPAVEPRAADAVTSDLWSVPAYLAIVAIYCAVGLLTGVW